MESTIVLESVGNLAVGENGGGSKIGGLLACWRDATVELVSKTRDLVVSIRKKIHSGDDNGAVRDYGWILQRGKDNANVRLESLRQAAYEIIMGYSAHVIGNPHQELVPWCGWLRAVQVRHLDWLIAWPEEEHLHP